MKKILITGSAGFIASQLIATLSKRDIEIVGVDNINEFGNNVQLKYDRLRSLGFSVPESISYGERAQNNLFPNVSFVRLAVEDTQGIDYLFKTESFDSVIHLAAQAGVRQNDIPQNVYYQSNIVGFRTIIDACQRYSIQKFIFASSSSVYGTNCTFPQKETDTNGTLCSYYAETKKQNERIALDYATQYGLPCIGLRFFSVYGPWGRPDMLPMKVADNIFYGEPLSIYNEGHFKRDFTYVSDVVDAIIGALNHQMTADAIPYKIYNVGNGQPITLREFIHAIENAFGKKAIPQYIQHSPQEDVSQTWADTTLLKKDLGVCPKWSLERGLSQFVKWYKEYHHNLFIVSLLTTKNRDSFYTALQTVTEQHRQPDLIVVVSDSTGERVEKERLAVETAHGIYLKAGINNHEHNYAGSLNIGIDYIVNECLIQRKMDASSIYIATLDDDDMWMPIYLEECSKVIQPSTDFVISGLIYHTEQETKELTIPNQLSIHSFLQGNPHIQGSNTFVKLSTLMKAGCFDEGMPSTTDRDIFVRIMQQTPQYSIVSKSLVHIYTNGERITTNREKKIEGLKQFYRKYHTLMSSIDKKQFNQRNSTYFGISMEDVCAPYSEIYNPPICHKSNRKQYEGHIIVGCIVTYQEGAKRLLQEIPRHIGGDYQIVLLNNTGEELIWLSTLPQPLRKRIDVILPQTKQRSIAENRQQLQEYVYKIWNHHNTVSWILDDDMQLKQIYADGHEKFLDIRKEILDYIGKYDAVVGGYTNDAPLPLLSTLRLSLLDYSYSQSPKTTSDGLKQTPDYYYALTDSGYTHLETPLYVQSCSLEDIFKGKMTRPLINQSTTIQEAMNRGGNTLILNRNLLLLPTCSLQIRDITARRGDYLWTLCVKQEGYKICQGTFCTFHNREKKAFDYDNEIKKMLCDLIGSSMTKAIEKVNLSYQEIHNGSRIICAYKDELQKRLVHFIENYYRIIGLLHVIGNEVNQYKDIFTKEHLSYFLKKIEEYSQPELIQTAFRELVRSVDLAKKCSHQDEYKRLLSQHLHVAQDTLHTLGYGNEGCVYMWNNRVYKVLYDSDIDLSQLIRFSPNLATCSLFYSLSFEREGKHTIISYPYESSQPLQSVKASDLSQLISFGKENGFVLTNLKPDNFIQTENGLKYIDYGKDIVPFSEQIYQRSIERAFQTFRYYFLSNLEFKEIISHSYNHTADAINAGLEIFRKMLIPTYKEQIHDPSIIQAIKQLQPKHILDYGAGKCKIANQLASTTCSVDVFDINTSILRERANQFVHIIEKASDIPLNAYDLINCNQVLCWIDDKQVQQVMHNVSQALKKDAYFVVSICNPFFSDIQHTMLRGGGRKESYYNVHTFQEYTSVGKAIDGLEHHRPVDWYIHQLQRYGFQIIDTWETTGIDTDTALPIGEHLVFVCKKITDYQVLADTTLMIKACAMDHEYIYGNIQHIVSQLEDGCIFAERVVCVDVSRTNCKSPIARQRAYNDDNQEHLLSELQRARHNGWIDRIIIPDIQDLSAIYTHYFQQQAANTHAQNGQPLFATLYGFQHIHTPYVYQTDCDILYKTQSGALMELYYQFTRRPIITVTPSIFHSNIVPDTEGQRVEVRTCFLNLSLLKTLLPLPNSIDGEYFVLPWHRCIDAQIKDKPYLSLRSGNPTLVFVHPTNTHKKDCNLITAVRYAMEKHFIPSCQEEHVDLCGEKYDWIPKANAPIVIISRGKNTPIEKVKRMLDSLIVQDKKFDIIYTDAHSTNSSEQYASFLFNYHPQLNRTIYISNQTDMKEIDLLMGAMRNIINPDALIVLVDNDDFLLRKDALSILWKQYQNGHDYICGNCIRYDKPNKKYSVSSFNYLWKRNGDNIWLHPICFRRKLFNMINSKDLQINGEYINVCTDFAYAIPLIQVAQNPCYQPMPIYYFEPSLANQKKEGKYNQQIVNETRDIILQKAKERYETNCSRYRR
ncbi:MAG: NAD-dependent epimerase/dehydratase family protein [Paludibacteraceae bacterium]|nr:NAD-dependent epimerase/dehydratase family protein [Paludibacteraceae bacterium]